MRRSLLLIGVLVALAAGCTTHANEDDRIPVTGNIPEEGTVDVLLDDYSVNPDTAEAEAGEVTFIARNDGTVVHELLVAQADAVEDLPTLDDGTVDEDALGAALLDGTSELTRGGTEQLALTLEEGSYVLFCNVDDHFERGMVASFTAEPEEVDSTTTTATA